MILLGLPPEADGRLVVTVGNSGMKQSAIDQLESLKLGGDGEVPLGPRQQ